MELNLDKKEVWIVIYAETPYSPADVGYDEERLSVLHKHFQKMGTVKIFSQNRFPFGSQ